MVLVLQRVYYIGGNLTVTGTFNGGAVEFGNIKIAQTTANTIDTITGNLNLNSTVGLVDINDTDVNGNLIVQGNSTLGNVGDATIVSGTLAVTQLLIQPVKQLVQS